MGNAVRQGCAQDRDHRSNQFLRPADALREEFGTKSPQYKAKRAEYKEINERLAQLSQRVEEWKKDVITDRVVELWDEADDLVSRYRPFSLHQQLTLSGLHSTEISASLVSLVKPAKAHNSLANAVRIHAVEKRAYLTVSKR